MSDHAIDGLFNRYAIFSSRKNFNDLFDSKVDIVMPSPRQLKELKRSFSGADKKIISSFVLKGTFTSDWFEYASKIEEGFNE